jgi:Fur family ferric uptake transcriptional regulator
MHDGLEAARRKLTEREYRLTPQREAVLGVFLSHPGQHLSAEDVHTLVKKTHPDIGLATVYRTLDLLANLEVLQKIDLGDGRARYELGNEEHHHHHLICIRCGRVDEFEVDLLESLEALVFKRTGFEVVDHQVKLFGLCRECRTAETGG